MGPPGPISELPTSGIHTAAWEGAVPFVLNPNFCFPSAPTPPPHKSQCLIPGS